MIMSAWCKPMQGAVVEMETLAISQSEAFGTEIRPFAFSFPSTRGAPAFELHFGDSEPL
jgi:hypothetical protein